MEDKLDYRPTIIDFDVVDNSIMPDVLGEFDSIQKMNEFIVSNELTVINEKITVFRKMDAFEKSELRKEYQDLLETMKPIYVKALNRAEIELKKAKEALAVAKENLNANDNLIDALSIEVKSGVTEISLDDISTFKLPYMSKNFYYTLIDGALKKCRVRDMADHEKTDLYSVMANNSGFIEDNFMEKVSDE